MVPAEVLSELGPLQAVNLHRLDHGVALHVVNYDYDESADAVRLLSDVKLGLVSAEGFTSARLYQFGAEPTDLQLNRDEDGVWWVTLPSQGLYSVIHFQR
jgi:hypothetical protein